jgi:stress response protein YsnF
VLSDREMSAAIGTTAHDADGDKIGTVEHFFLDDRAGTPSWVAVTTGLFGTRHSVAPVQGARFTEGGLVLAVTREAVRGAPELGRDGHLGPDDEDRLRRHYGLLPDGPPVPVPPARAAERADSGTAGSGMVRSEEQLRVDTEQVAARRVRLVKYVVTEQVQLTVPIRREEIRVEEVPLEGPGAEPGESLVPAGAAPEGAGGDLPDEIVLHTERPVVSFEVVPTERVRLRTERVQGEERVTGQVQRERIVVDEDRGPRAG